MSWSNTKVEDVRLEFIIAVKSQLTSVIDVCRAFGISPKTGYKWLKRYEEGGKEALLDRSRRPQNRPLAIRAELEAAIVSERRRYPRWGPKKILKVLQRNYPNESWPSRTTVANVLKRNNCVNPRTKRSRLATAAPFEECHAPNEVWSADFKGWWKTGNGSICQPFTLMDSHTRFLFSCRPVKKVSAKVVKPLLIEVFQEFGMPDRFRSDNGPPFASTSIGRLSHFSIWLIKLGITPEWITPGKPQENGRHERMHRTLKAEVDRSEAWNLKQQDELLSGFQHEYNFVRPHEALSMETPGSIYTPSTRPWNNELKDPTYLSSNCETRIVDKSGYVYWKGTRFFTSELLYRERVGITETGMLSEVYYGPILLGYIDPIGGFKRI